MVLILVKKESFYLVVLTNKSYLPVRFYKITKNTGDYLWKNEPITIINWGI